MNKYVFIRMSACKYRAYLRKNYDGSLDAGFLGIVHRVFYGGSGDLWEAFSPEGKLIGLADKRNWAADMLFKRWEISHAESTF